MYVGPECLQKLFEYAQNVHRLYANSTLTNGKAVNCLTAKMAERMRFPNNFRRHQCTQRSVSVLKGYFFFVTVLEKCNPISSRGYLLDTGSHKKLNGTSKPLYFGVFVHLFCYIITHVFLL